MPLDGSTSFLVVGVFSTWCCVFIYHTPSDVSVGTRLTQWARVTLAFIAFGLSSYKNTKVVVDCKIFQNV